MSDEHVEQSLAAMLGRATGTIVGVVIVFAAACLSASLAGVVIGCAVRAARWVISW